MIGPRRLHLEPQTGCALSLRAGDLLRVVAPLGEQVADLTAFSAESAGEWLSSGRTIDYKGSIYLSKGDVLYSNRSRVMLTIEEDTAGRHDFLLAPCSLEMFHLLHGVTGHHPSCFENLATHLGPFGIHPDQIPTTLNLFMNVAVDPESGRITVGVPSSGPGDHVALRAAIDLVVGVTACSAELSNNGSFKPIDVEVVPSGPEAAVGTGGQGRRPSPLSIPE